MANEEEKTEEPTAKKIEKAREEGNVPKSMETSGFLSLLVGFIALFVFFWWVVGHINNLYRYYTSFIGEEITSNTIVAISIRTMIDVGLILAPFAIALVIAGIVGNVSQFGFNFTTKVLTPKFEKLNPIKGFKNVISIKKLIEGFMITLKVFISLIVGFYIFYLFLQELVTVSLFPLPEQLVWFKDRAMILIGVMLLLFLAIAMIDLAIKRYQYFKGLRMSKHEVKDEFKQMEGNPEIKRRIRQIMMQASAKRMMQEIPSADVVVTNPTHYAVALRYDTSKERAPKVVAKGVDNVALKIKEIALEHDIQIVENPPLARELYKLVEVDREIPEALYQAVAEVLAYVHKISKKYRD